MNTKGDIRISYLIGGIVAIFVLFVVGFGAYSFFSGKAIPFFDFLPGFNRTVERVSGIEILRYDIIDEKVQYYDKAYWRDFEGEVFLGDKRVKYGDVKRDFERFYYESKRENNLIEIEQRFSLIGILDLVNSYNNNIILIDKNLQDWSRVLGSSLNLKSYKIYVPDGVSIGYRRDLELSFARFGSIGCEKCKSGDVEFQLMNKELSRGSPISFVLGLDDTFSILYSDIKQLSKINVKEDLLNRIFNGMMNWRESVFDKPIRISYSEDDIGIVNHFCSELRDKRYIVVDLSKGVDIDKKCENG